MNLQVFKEFVWDNSLHYKTILGMRFANLEFGSDVAAKVVFCRFTQRDTFTWVFPCRFIFR